jgi:hypothetical protein
MARTQQESLASTRVYILHSTPLKLAYLLTTTVQGTSQSNNCSFVCVVFLAWTWNKFDRNV